MANQRRIISRLHSRKAWAAFVRISCLAALLCLVATISGCLDGDVGTDAYYDPQTDSLHFLAVYCNIQAHNDAETKYLASLWANRQDFIPEFMPHINIFGETSGSLRVGDHSSLSISLGEVKAKSDPGVVDYSLDSIRIKPGVFFRGDASTSLCYYQQLEIPGAAVDAALASIQRPLLEELKKQAGDEIKRRNKAEPVSTWDDLRSTLHPEDPNVTLTDEQKAAKEFKSDPIHCLSDDSLLMLINPPAEVKCGFARQGNDLTFTIAVAPVDQEEIVKSVQLALSAFKAELGKLADSSGGLVHSINSVKFLSGPGNAISVKATLVDMVGGAFDYNRFEQSLKGKKNASTPDKDKSSPAQFLSADWVTSFGATLNTSVTLQNIHEQFVKGTLPVDAPAAPTSEETRNSLFTEK